MNQAAPNLKLVKAFIGGAIFGLLAYTIYMWPGREDGYHWLAQDEPFTTALGSIFFPVQYLIFCFGDHWDYSNATTMALLFTLVAGFYGYIFMSIRLYPWVAFWTCGISIFLYFFLIFAFPDSRWRILKLLLWHIALLGHAFAVSDFPIRAVRILIYCFTQGIWYAGLVCGVCTFFRPLRKGQPLPQK